LPSAQTVTRARAQAEPPARPSLAQRAPEQQPPQFNLVRQARLSGLDSADAFTAKAGKPKDDLSFGFLGKYRRDEGYKAVLGGMEKYQAKAAADGTSNAGVKQDLGKLAGMLDDLAGAASRYQTQDASQGGARKAAFDGLGSQIANEKQAIGDLVTQLNQGATFPTGATLADAIAFAREGVSLKDMAALMARGLDASQAKEGREVIDNQRAIAVLDNADRMAPYLARGFDKGDVFLLESAGHTIEVGAMYKDMRVAITHQTIVKGLVEDQVQGDVTQLGKGGCNTVFRANFATPDGVLNGAFKPLQKEETGWVAYKTGVDQRDPQIVMRNLATGDVARQLGFDVVVKTQLGLCRPPIPEGQPATAARPLQLGMVMALAQGDSGWDTKSNTFLEPGVQRELTKLQLLDHLVGQGDRHGGNYFIHKDDNGQFVVTGIDNDQCFGALLTDPNGIRNRTGDAGFVNSSGMQDSAGVDRPRFNKKEEGADGVVVRTQGWNSDGFRGTNMPLVIDTEMAAALRNLTPQTLDKLLGARVGKGEGDTLAGKLTPAEVTATQTRLTAMLAHVDQLEANGRVIDPSRWGTEEINEIVLRDSAHSYAGRDFKSARDSEWAKGDIFN
jgi:hypothetical protein